MYYHEKLPNDDATPCSGAPSGGYAVAPAAPFGGFSAPAPIFAPAPAPFLGGGEITVDEEDSVAIDYGELQNECERSYELGPITADYTKVDECTYGSCNRIR